MMSGELRLNLPWVPRASETLGELVVRRARHDQLALDDGTARDVVVIDPSRYPSLPYLLAEVRQHEADRKIVLVAGAIPVEWRGRLRSALVSFLDVSGVAEIEWPRVRASARRFGRGARRRSAPLPLQKTYAVVAQETLHVASGGRRVTLGEIAEEAKVSASSASRATDELQSHGLVIKAREGRHAYVSVVDPVELAVHLAERTAWRRQDSLGGYLWGRNSFEIAARLSAQAAEKGIDLAVTGRVGAAFHGVVGTASPPDVRCWVTGAESSSLEDVAVALQLEEASEEEANVALVVDRWRAGRHRSHLMSAEGSEAIVSHPLRVWCDLHDEQRGEDFAAQMWGVVSDGW